jgi:hypothetical protein
MKRSYKKLSLKRSTVSNLGTDELRQQVGGGSAGNGYGCGGTNQGCSGICTAYACTYTCKGPTCRHKCGF